MPRCGTKMLDTVDTSQVFFLDCEILYLFILQEIKDLQEQLRDVMFYFKAQEQLTSTNTVSQAEIQEGQIVVGESPPHAGPKRRHKKGGR